MTNSFLYLIVSAACLFTHPVASQSLRGKAVDADHRDLKTNNNNFNGEMMLESKLFMNSASLSAPLSASAAMENAMKFYETLREMYLQEQCQETWGEFPTSSTQGAAMKPMPNHLQSGAACKCGMIHDLAASHIVTEQDRAFVARNASAALSLEELEHKELYEQLEENALSASKLESWMIAGTSNGAALCSDGFAGPFPCENVDMVAHLSLNAFRTNAADYGLMASDLWGWTSGDGREFVIIGVMNAGFYFVEVSVSSDPVILAFLEVGRGSKSAWRDVKVIGEFCYMGSEARNHGLQIFDLRTLLSIDPQTDCENTNYCKKVTSTKYSGTESYPIRGSHNIVANEDSNFVYVVGAKAGANQGGLHVVNVTDPLMPLFAGVFDEVGYIHDAQCVNYNGPDTDFNSGESEICFCFAEDSVTIVDVTDKGTMTLLSTIEYKDSAYTHQGWLSSDQSYIVFSDELDEYEGLTESTKTLVLDVSDLTNPFLVGTHEGATPAIDHNQYIVKATAKGQDYDPAKFGDTDLIYQANYERGLEILQVIQYNPVDFRLVGYFDTYPTFDTADFNGAWSVYPYFSSGLVAISSMDEGLFLVKPNLENALV